MTSVILCLGFVIIVMIVFLWRCIWFLFLFHWLILSLVVCISAFFTFYLQLSGALKTHPQIVPLIFFFQYWFCLLGLLMQIAVLWLHFNCLYFFLIFSNNFLKSLPGFQLPIFPSQFVVSTTNLSTSIYRLFLFLRIIENLSNKKPQISKYIFVSCTRWRKICVHPSMSQDMFLGAMVFCFVFLFIATHP